jgi:transcription-repair coupling factor (superfamily II helicase)
VAEAVAEIKGEPVRTRHLPLFEIAAEAYIPEQYVTSESQKITLYKRIAGLQSEEEVGEMLAELKDRFGEPPAPVRRLLDVMRVRALGADAGARRIVGGRNGVTVELQSGRQLERGRRESLSHAFGDRLVFEWKETPSVTFKLEGQADENSVVTAAQQLLRALIDV